MQHGATSPANVEVAEWIDTARDHRRMTQPALETLLELAADARLPPSARRDLARAIDLLRGQGGAAAADAAHSRALLEAVPDAITLHGENGDVVEANAAACRLYGYAREALLGLNLLDLCPALPPDHVAHVVETCRSGKAVTIETTLRRSDRREFPVEIRSGVHDEGGVRRLLCVARGIGHWKRVAEGLHDAEQRYHVLLHSLDQGVMIRDAGSGRIVYFNPAAYRIFRLSEGELAHLDDEGFPGWHYTDPDGQPLRRDELPTACAMRTGNAVESQVVCFWTPHLRRPLWISTSAVPLFRRGETRPFQVVATFTDISELKRANDLLEQTQATGHVGGFEHAFDTEEVVWTEQMYRLFDLPGNGTVTLDRFLSMLEPHSRALAQHDIEAIKRGETVHREIQIHTALGRRRWLSGAMRPIRRGERIHGIAGMFQDVTERKLLEQELRRKAVTDSVTGLANRESILEELNRQIVSTRDDVGPTLLYLDLDRFKVINDILGANAGDQLLASAARRLQECLPEGARCGRFAGDEFLVVLPRSLREEQPGEIAETINAKFRRPFEYGGEEFVITVSIGLARYPADGTTAQELLHHSDAAMSEAKQRGRSAWQAFSPAIARRLEHNVAIENQLRHALGNGELELVYQPTIELERGNVVAIEALLR